MPTERLVLGTAQLGLRYGIANTAGKPDSGLAEEIVAEAFSQGIEEFDTAQAYGDSELVLGNALAAKGLNDRVRIVSKLSADADMSSASAISASFHASLERLQCYRLEAFMLHDESMLAHWCGPLREALVPLRQKGRIGLTGASVHSVEGLRSAIGITDISCVQFPANVFDHRFSKHIEQIEKRCVKIYARSVFLQGLFFIKPERVPATLADAAPLLHRLQRIASEFDCSVHEICMHFVRELLPQAKIVLGSESPEQVAENARLWKKSAPDELLTSVNNAFPSVSENILDPWNW